MARRRMGWGRGKREAGENKPGRWTVNKGCTSRAPRGGSRGKVMADQGGGGGGGWAGEKQSWPGLGWGRAAIK